MIANFAPIVILIVLFYFLLIRPQRKRDKAEREMRNSIEVGDEISTIGGFIGRVVNIKDDVLIIESSNDRTKLKIYRWAIRGKEAPATETVEAPKEANKDAK
ncbi:MAG TPA: preprotein translocase subunit YajC [Candidatus Agathobaculum pullistercoris]|nr:preprotein translocase subunit YajC [Candidatus Agathobaculum pullistercoris]